MRGRRWCGAGDTRRGDAVRLTRRGRRGSVSETGGERLRRLEGSEEAGRREGAGDGSCAGGGGGRSAREGEKPAQETKTLVLTLVSNTPKILWYCQYHSFGYNVLRGVTKHLLVKNTTVFSNIMVLHKNCKNTWLPNRPLACAIKKMDLSQTAYYWIWSCESLPLPPFSLSNYSTCCFAYLK